MSENVETKKSIFKKWLETLQQESWQLELLISGLALFGVFGAKSLIDELETFLNLQFFSGSVNLGVAIFIFLLKGSWYIFLINLVIHIILRGLWIGAIGLRYVSEDIDYKKLNFSPYFYKLYTRRYKSFDDYIEDLEKICSVIFAYTFLLYFILISACLFLAWPLVCMSVLGPMTGTFVVLIYLLLGLFVFVDFILLNPLKKVKDGWFSVGYGFLFRFYSTITLSFIFRPLLLNFLDNKFTKRLFLFSIPYGLVIILLLPGIKSESVSYFPEFKSSSLTSRALQSQTINPYIYDDLRPMDYKKLHYVSLPNYVNTGSVLEFFLVHFRSDEFYFSDIKNISALVDKGIYTSFKKNTSVDSAYVKIEKDHNLQDLDYVKKKSENVDDLKSEQWDSILTNLVGRQNEESYNFYSYKMEGINSSFKSLCEFYIDENVITDQVSCLASVHVDSGEKGWRCFTTLDTINNGLHTLKVVRNVYQSKKKQLSPRVLEIPFILDKS